MTDADTLTKGSEILQAHTTRLKGSKPTPFDLQLMKLVEAQPELLDGNTTAQKVHFARLVVDLYERMDDALQALPCARKGCTNGRATHAVEFTVYASRAQDPKRERGASAQALHPETGQPLGICDEHAKTATIDDWLTDDGFQKVSDGLDAKGYARPVRARSRLTLRKLDLKPLH